MLPVVLYGSETWSLIFREERRLGIFDNAMLKRIFGPETDEVARKWRKQGNEELYDLLSSPNIVREIESGKIIWAGHTALMGDSRGLYRVLLGKTEGKRPLGRRWIRKMDLQELGCGGMGWIDLAQNG